MVALHLKLDELIRVSKPARNRLLTLEDMTDEDLARLKGTFSDIADRTTDDGLLQEAAQYLETATEDIEDAKDKVSAAARRRS